MNPNEPKNPVNELDSFDVPELDAVPDDPLHKLWLEASEATAPIALECTDEKAAKAFRHRLYRWRDKHPELCTKEMLTVSLTVEGSNIVCRPALINAVWKKLNE